MSTTTETKPHEKESWGELIKTILYAGALAMCIRFVIAQPFRIPSGSMQPTLLVGDYMIVSKWSYGYSRFSLEPLNFGFPHGRLFGHEPKRGDVIVFRPEPQLDKDLVKRLIGLPGDKIQMRDGALYINGQGVQREDTGQIQFKQQDGDIVDLETWKETLPNGVSYTTFDREPDGRLDSTPVYEVPAGHYFFMGDDRDNSADSRTPEVTYVPFENLVGKVQIIFLSYDPSTSLFKPWTLITGLRADRFVKPVNK
jgi:signal peptidase I